MRLMLQIPINLILLLIFVDQNRNMAQRKRIRKNLSCDSSEEDGDTGDEEEVTFSQPGSIIRLKFCNFMQYTDVEFHCGPNLNVIIG